MAYERSKDPMLAMDFWRSNETSYQDLHRESKALRQQLAECERERDELVTALQVIVNTNPIYGASHDIARSALAKLGAGVKGDGS